MPFRPAQLDVSQEFQYATEVVDVGARDLPGVKAAFVVERVDDNSVVLDVGCGGGKTLRTISIHRHGVELLGCDVKQPADINGDFAFRELDGSTGLLPYDDAAVDTALVLDVLEHVERPQKVLEEIARVLRPGGKLIAFVPIEGERLSWYRAFRAVLGQDLYVRTKTHVNAFTHDQVEQMLDDRFIVEERRYLYHFFGQLMDAGLCAALTLASVRRAFWTHSPYHGESAAPSSTLGRLVATVFRAANLAAWYESRLLMRVRTTSSGVLVAATVRPVGNDDLGRRAGVYADSRE